MLHILCSGSWIMEVMYGWVEIRSVCHSNSGGNFHLEVWHGRTECQSPSGNVGRGIKRVLGICSLDNGWGLSEVMAVNWVLNRRWWNSALSDAGTLESRCLGHAYRHTALKNHCHRFIIWSGSICRGSSLRWCMIKTTGVQIEVLLLLYTEA